MTDEQRSLLASALVAGIADRSVSLCCGDDRIAACARIVGERRATDLATWFYESLGCVPSHEQSYLDKIAELEELPFEVEAIEIGDGVTLLR